MLNVFAVFPGSFAQVKRRGEKKLVSVWEGYKQLGHSLVPKPICAMQVSGGGLKLNAIANAPEKLDR